MPELLTMREVQAALRIGRQTAYRMCWDGQLPSVRVRGRRFVTADALRAYLDRNTQGRRTEEQ